MSGTAALITGRQTNNQKKKKNKREKQLMGM